MNDNEELSVIKLCLTSLVFRNPVLMSLHFQMDT